MLPAACGPSDPETAVRILIDFTPAVRQTAGIGRITRQLVRRFPWRDAGLDPYLFVSGRRGEGPRTEAGLDLHYTPLRERDMTRLWHRADIAFPTVDQFSAVRPHIFHATDFVLPPSRARCKILTVHDLAFRRDPETAVPSLRHYLERVVPRSVERSDFIIADSHSAARDLQEFWSVSPERVAVVPAGVDAKEFHKVSDAGVLQSVRRRYSIGEAPYILALSTIQPRKNFVRLVEAFALLRDRHSGLKLVIGGKRGWKYQDLFRRVLELGLEEEVVFPGFVKDEDLPALYSGAELFAYPSLYEGFGIPILEAMACETPVVASVSSSLAEAGGPGPCYADPLSVDSIEDCMERVLSNSQLRQAMTAAGLRHAALYSWRRCALKLWEAYSRAWDSVC